MCTCSTRSPILSSKCHQDLHFEFPKGSTWSPGGPLGTPWACFGGLGVDVGAPGGLLEVPRRALWSSRGGLGAPRERSRDRVGSIWRCFGEGFRSILFVLWMLMAMLSVLVRVRVWSFVRVVCGAVVQSGIDAARSSRTQSGGRWRH